MNTYMRQNKKYKLLCCLFSSMFTLAAPGAAVADSYLDALHEEAGKMEYLDETRPSNAITDRKKTINPETQKALQSIKDFEEYYRKQDSADSSIYFRLDTQDRLRIYHRFKTTRDFDVARKMTIEIFNKKK